MVSSGTYRKAVQNGGDSVLCMPFSMAVEITPDLYDYTFDVIPQRRATVKFIQEGSVRIEVSVK